MGARFQRAAALGFIAFSIISGAAGCSAGGDDTAKQMSAQQKIDDARREGARDEKIRQLQQQLRERKGGGKTASTTTAPAGGGTSRPAGAAPTATSGPTSCGDGLSAGPKTSCPFASAVREEYPGSSDSFEVYSSVTGDTYSMSCTTGTPHVCRGGNDASVYFP